MRKGHKRGTSLRFGREERCQLWKRSLAFLNGCEERDRYNTWKKGPNLFLNGPGSSKTPKETRLHINSQHSHWTSKLQPLLTAIKSNSSRSPGPLLYDDQGYLVPTLGASRPDIPTGLHLPSRPPQVFVSPKHSRQARGRQNPAP